MSKSKNEALRSVLHELGVVLYISQLFETNVLFLVSLLSKKDGCVSAESFRSAYEKNIEKTLGQLARKFESQLKPPSDFEMFIRKAVEARNSVVHGYALRNRERLMTVAGRAEIVDELREIQHLINERLTATSEMLDRALKVFGGSIDQLGQEAEFLFEYGNEDESTKH